MASHATTGLQEFLALALLILVPVWAYLRTRKLRTNSALKLSYYKQSIATMWILAAIATWATGLRVFMVHRSAAAIPWLLGSPTTKLIAAALLLLFFAAALLPGIRGARSSKSRHAYNREYQRAMAFVLPGTEEEIRWFTLLCISAGICEEILFRGFFLPFLHHGPWPLSWTLALLVSSLSFGLNHLYQGISGVLSTALAGLAFGIVFLLTGNLVLPILLHIAVDLQVVLVLRPPDAQPARRRRR
jgi:membrane protease YdiL (CAAX protease family)